MIATKPNLAETHTITHTPNLMVSRITDLDIQSIQSIFVRVANTYGVMESNECPGVKGHISED